MKLCLTLACAIFACLLGSAEAADRPNILWITSEDNGVSWIGCYGGVNSKTPAIDQLAKEGFRYTHCFDNAAVCAPTRSSWITGMHAISLGTQPMRSRNLIPHDVVKYYPDLLREAGYFATNGGKTDFNIGGRDDDACWDPGRGSRAWRKREAGQPFFSIVNIGVSHESSAHGDNQNTKNDPATMKLYSYHPDLPAIRRTYAKYADAVERMDAIVGETINQLKADGLYEDTIVVYCSDHGGVMPRSKRFLYSSGIHCPMVVRI
ncbi:MAG: sulfatase-like hydrolase/transferase, partial [Rhodopirellula bahusiensis]